MTSPLAYRPDIQDWTLLRPGEFCYRRAADGRPKWLAFWPADAAAPVQAAIRPQRNAVGSTLDLFGPEDRPWLSPSVNAEGVWHGWLRDGVAVTC